MKKEREASASVKSRIINPQALLTTGDVATMLGCHINTIRRYSNTGELSSLRIGRREDRRYTHDDVVNFLTKYNPGRVEEIKKWANGKEGRGETHSTRYARSGSSDIV